MLFAIKLSYIRPIEEVQKHLDAHKAWLTRYVKDGIIIFAGPIHQAEGGFVLAHGTAPPEIEGMIASDPFAIHNLVTFDILCCDPAIRAEDFPECWAEGAKPI